MDLVENLKMEEELFKSLMNREFKEKPLERPHPSKIKRAYSLVIDKDNGFELLHYVDSQFKNPKFWNVFQTRLSRYKTCSLGFTLNDGEHITYFVRIENEYMHRQYTFHSHDLSVGELNSKILQVQQLLSKIRQHTKEKIIMAINEVFLNQSMNEIIHASVIEADEQQFSKAS